MIGPEPTIRMRWMSLRLGILLHQPDEIFEQIERIVRARSRFRMILHAEHGMISMTEAFESIVVQIGVCDFDFVKIQRVRIDREAVVMRSDFHFACNAVQDRMVAAAKIGTCPTNLAT